MVLSGLSSGIWCTERNRALSNSWPWEGPASSPPFISWYSHQGSHQQSCLRLWNWDPEVTKSWSKIHPKFSLWLWIMVTFGDQTTRKSTLNIHQKDWCWSSNTLATWYKKPTHWKRPWCWERLKATGEGGHRGWDGWMASLTQHIWVWANSGDS